jgi:hypothetical protein
LAALERHSPQFRNWKLDFLDHDLAGRLDAVGQKKGPGTEWVYLTADSPHTLQTLEPGKTYIIGGLVDHNAHKNLCLTKAESLSISSAKLPIGEFLSLGSRKVLTVNQVVEIMVQWLENGGDWREAFLSVIPKRKGVQEKDEPVKESPVEGLNQGLPLGA